MNRIHLQRLIMKKIPLRFIVLMLLTVFFSFLYAGILLSSGVFFGFGNENADGNYGRIIADVIVAAYFFTVFFFARACRRRTRYLKYSFICAAVICILAAAASACLYSCLDEKIYRWLFGITTSFAALFPKQSLNQVIFICAFYLLTFLIFTVEYLNARQRHHASGTEAGSWEELQKEELRAVRRELSSSGHHHRHHRHGTAEESRTETNEETESI